MSLSKTLYPLLNTGSTQEVFQPRKTSLDMTKKDVDWDTKESNKIKIVISITLIFEAMF